MLIAIPSDAPGGLDAQISEHFGHSDVFTLVQVDDGQVGEVSVLPNDGHSQGGCMAPVMLLKNKGADALIAGGMGMTPLSGFQQVGITVFQKEDAATVGEAVQRIIEGKGHEFDQQQTCSGHDSGCGHHHHEPIERETVDGPVEKDRVAVLSYKLTNDEGELLDSAQRIEYMHGHGHIVAGLEQAIEGHVAGDEIKVTVAPENGYGERDESRTVKVPLAELPPDVVPGAIVQAQMPNGGIIQLTVMSIDGDEATMDANHPLAGQTLHFEVKVLEVQAATEAELQ